MFETKKNEIAVSNPVCEDAEVGCRIKETWPEK
jgi:hypothetical protein